MILRETYESILNKTVEVMPPLNINKLESRTSTSGEAPRANIKYDQSSIDRSTDTTKGCTGKPSI